MNVSEIINVILGGGLVATIVALMTLRSTVRKAKAEAGKEEAEAEKLRIDNTEHATRILMENIVKPLKEEMNETKKELARNTREMARLRKALNAANSCDYRDDCPVLGSMREQQKERGEREQPTDDARAKRQRGKRQDGDCDGDGADVGGETDAEGGQPP